MSGPKPRPTETQCPVCNKLFLQPVRKQGGGRRTIYCSHNCCAKDWLIGNGAKRKASVLKYDTMPENKHKKRLRARTKTLKRHGWSEEKFNLELSRQGYSCYGCLRPIGGGGPEDERAVARIDHDHKTHKIRGLLCNECNLGIGYLKDNPTTLRRLMSYLDRNRETFSVYIIGALKNNRIPDIGNLLREKCFDVMDEWFTPGELADLNWQAYEKKRGRSYCEALRGRAATNIFLFDRSYLDLCDTAVLVMPAGKSAMIELGYAKGRGKKTVIYLDGQDPDRYDIMPNFADVICNTEAELLETLNNFRSKEIIDDIRGR